MLDWLSCDYGSIKFLSNKMKTWTFSFVLICFPVPCLSENYVIQSNITGNKCIQNTTVAFWCTVDTLLTGSEDVLWFRKVGESRQLIGQSSMLSVELYGGRYRISRLKKTYTSVTYELTMSPVLLEDSAMIQCVSPTSKQINTANSLALAVCENLNSSFCDCIAQIGWAAPMCNEIIEKAKSKRYESKKGCIGIAVCLASILIAAVILTILLIMKELDSRKEKTTLKAEEKHIQLPEPKGPSILKKMESDKKTVANNQLQIDSFSMLQLQNISFKGVHNPKLTRDPPRSFPADHIYASTERYYNAKDFPTSNFQIVHEQGDIHYFKKMPDGSPNLEYQI